MIVAVTLAIPLALACLATSDRASARKISLNAPVIYKGVVYEKFETEYQPPEKLWELANSLQAAESVNAAAIKAAIYNGEYKRSANHVYFFPAINLDNKHLTHFHFALATPARVEKVIEAAQAQQPENAYSIRTLSQALIDGKTVESTSRYIEFDPPLVVNGKELDHIWVDTQRKERLEQLLKLALKKKTKYTEAIRKLRLAIDKNDGTERWRVIVLKTKSEEGTSEKNIWLDNKTRAQLEDILQEAKSSGVDPETVTKIEQAIKKGRYRDNKKGFVHFNPAINLSGRSEPITSIWVHDWPLDGLEKLLAATKLQNPNNAAAIEKLTARISYLKNKFPLSPASQQEDPEITIQAGNSLRDSSMSVDAALELIGLKDETTNTEDMEIDDEIEINHGKVDESH